MTLYGIIKSFNPAHGCGSIKPESGGNDLSFDRNSFATWKIDKPEIDRRISYEDGMTGQGVPCAMKLQVASSPCKQPFADQVDVTGSNASRVIESPSVLRNAQWSAELTTRSGFHFYLRPARPDDEAALAEFFGRVSAEDLRFRFLTAVRTVSHDVLVNMTNVDHDRTESFLAFDGGTLIASAMLVADSELARAEIAIAVHADFKGRGVGWTLLEYAARYAQAKGITVLESIESSDNGSAVRIEKEMGFSVKPYPGDATLMLLERTLGAPHDNRELHSLN